MVKVEIVCMCLPVYVCVCTEVLGFTFFFLGYVDVEWMKKSKPDDTSDSTNVIRYIYLYV